MERRNTIQREIVLSTVLKLQKHATAEEIYEFIHKEHPTIGRGTIYRNLNILAKEDKIRKIEVPGGSDRYDHICEKHYHVKCVKCGKLFDVDMESVPNLMEFIRDTQGVEFINFDIMFSGICPNCQE